MEDREPCWVKREGLSPFDRFKDPAMREVARREDDSRDEDDVADAPGRDVDA